MIETIVEWDESLFLFLNNLQADWLDAFMLAITGKYIWIPLYAFWLYWIVKYYKKDSIWFILGLVLVIVVADQTASGLMKPYFGRLRPCHDPRWEDLLYNYSGCGGQFGFVSSHAANTFAMATFLFLLFRQKIKWVFWMFLWALLVSYSRIYLGVHYPLDIFFGALVGVFSAWGIYEGVLLFGRLSGHMRGREKS